MSAHYTTGAPTALEVRADCRLVAVLPLSGDLSTSAHIYMHEFEANDEPPVYWIVDRSHSTDGYVIPWLFDHLHDALKRALSNSGWGDYTITPPEGINW